MVRYLSLIIKRVLNKFKEFEKLIESSEEDKIILINNLKNVKKFSIFNHFKNK